VNEPRQVCPTCGGSGEIGYFQGVSRFFITREECPACFGVGTVDAAQSASDDGQDADNNEPGG